MKRLMLVVLVFLLLSLLYGQDRTITSLPYNQNFDSCTPPGLPEDWSMLADNAANTLTTVNSTAYNGSNSLRLHAADASYIYCIFPQIAIGISTADLRASFYAKADTPGMISIGWMTDPLDTSTFVQISQMSLTTTWANHYFDGYGGAPTARYLAIRLAGTADMQNVYIDDTRLSFFPAFDLAALSISGNMAPIINTCYNYDVLISSVASQFPQAGFTLKLLNQDDIELASSQFAYTGTLGGSCHVSLSWTPEDTTTTAIYARLIMANDGNSSNDATPPVPVHIMAQGNIQIPVGEYELTARLPVSSNYNSSICEVLYYASELGAPSLINGICLYNSNNCSVSTTYRNMRIYIGNTTLNDLHNGWIPLSQMTQVYYSEAAFPPYYSTVAIPFDAPFAYTGGNLVVAFVCPYITGNDYYASIQCDFTDALRTLMLGSNIDIDYSSVEPEYTPPRYEIPKTVFFVTPSSPTAAFAFAPNTHNMFQCALQDTLYQWYTITNAGNQPLVISSISNPNTSSFRTLLYSPNLILTTGQTLRIKVLFTPHAYGEHNDVLTITDNTSPQPHSFALSGSCPSPVIHQLPYQTNFDNMRNTLPLDWSITSPFTAVSSSTNPFSPPYSIRFDGPADPPELPLLVMPRLGDNIPPNSVVLHFKARGHLFFPCYMDVGIVTDPANEDTFVPVSTFTLTANWQDYTADFSAYAGSGRYIAFRKSATQTIYYYLFLDDVVLQSNLTNLAGIITQATTHSPVSGASLWCESYTASSNNAGAFSLSLPPGIRTVHCTAAGYDTLSQTIEVNANGTTVLNFVLNPVSVENPINIAVTRLHASYPNPFSQTTTINYDIKQSTPVTLSIYNVKGQLVRKLVDERKANGRYTAVWDGRDEYGRQTASGIYTCRMQAGRYHSTTRMVLLR